MISIGLGNNYNYYYGDRDKADYFEGFSREAIC